LYEMRRERVMHCQLPKSEVLKHCATGIARYLLNSKDWA
jgi:hypothetical protein